MRRLSTEELRAELKETTLADARAARQDWRLWQVVSQTESVEEARRVARKRDFPEELVTSTQALARMKEEYPEAWQIYRKQEDHRPGSVEEILTEFQPWPIRFTNQFEALAEGKGQQGYLYLKPSDAPELFWPYHCYITKELLAEDPFRGQLFSTTRSFEGLWFIEPIGQSPLPPNLHLVPQSGLIGFVRYRDGASRWKEENYLRWDRIPDVEDYSEKLYGGGGERGYYRHKERLIRRPTGSQAGEPVFTFFYEYYIDGFYGWQAGDLIVRTEVLLAGPEGIKLLPEQGSSCMLFVIDLKYRISIDAEEETHGSWRHPWFPEVNLGDNPYGDSVAQTPTRGYLEEHIERAVNSCPSQIDGLATLKNLFSLENLSPNSYDLLVAK